MSAEYNKALEGLPYFVDSGLSSRKAEFQSHMVIIRHLAETADKEEGEYIYRNLLQTCAYLERKHGLKK